jgi:3-oxoacyl-[acyl-carrier-protein] synthase II
VSRRVVVTGAGVVTPFGCDVTSFWTAVKAGRSGLRALAGADAVPGGIRVGAPVEGFSAREHVDAKSLRLMAPAVAFGVAAADLAVTDAGLPLEALDPARLGVFMGSRGHSSDRQDLLPGVRVASEDGTFRLSKFGAEGLPLVHPMWLLKGLANNVLYFVSLKHNAQGMNNNISLGGVGGTMAIGEAFEAIRRGYLDAAIAGGYDSALDVDRLEMFGMSGLATPARTPAGAGAPFDRRRSGFVAGEGAGMLVLETYEAARRRGARMYGEVRGYGTATSPRSPKELGPSARGFAAALDAAIADAGALPDAVFAHGLATRESDVEETAALKTVLGSRASRTPVPAIKSMVGNSFAASGPLEAVAALAALGDGCLPPTVGLTDPDPACDLDYVAGTTARAVSLATIALNNANLGGGHAALVIGRL